MHGCASHAAAIKLPEHAVSVHWNMNRLACQSEGLESAPAVVLLHSLATDASLWRFQTPVWSPHLRLISVDLPGHGRSAALDTNPTLDAFADALIFTLDAWGVKKAAFVGLSLGGMVAQSIALRFPERVRSLVLAHTSARTSESMQQIWASRITMLADLGMEGQVQGTLARWFTTEFSARAPLTLEWIASLIRQTPPDGYADAVRAIQRLDYLERLSGVAAPALVVAGAQDTAAPPAAAAAMIERLANARMFVIERCAHLGNVEQAALFTERVGAFLLETAAA